jgi:hypothetical protein
MSQQERETPTRELTTEQMQQNRDQALQLADSLRNVDADATLAPLSGAKAFAVALRMAANLSQSSLVPKAFRGNPEDIVIAMDIAHRTNMGLFAVLQSLYIVHGKPGFSASFLVACLNATGRFGPIGYEESGDGDNRGCLAYATDLRSGEVRKGARITIGMAKAEKWHDRDGSKWKTMPEQMLRYRAATFFVRAYAPDVALGLPTSDELQDIGPVELQPIPAGERQPEDFGVKAKSDKAPRNTPKPAAEPAPHDADFADSKPAAGASNNVEKTAQAKPAARTKVVDGATVDLDTGEVISDPKADKPATSTGDALDRAKAAQAELDEARAAADKREQDAARAKRQQQERDELAQRQQAEREQLEAAERRREAAHAAQEQQAAPAAAPAGQPLTDGMRSMVQRKVDAAGTTMDALIARMGSDIHRGNVNDAFALLENWNRTDPA